jgi:hypothetical protein
MRLQISTDFGDVDTARNALLAVQVGKALIATRSYNLRRILIALGAVISEMAFTGQVGMDISRNDHPRVRRHVVRYLPSYCFS